MGNYRNDLEQAHRRIEHLETELAEARGAKPKPKASPVPLVLLLAAVVLLGAGIGAAVFLRGPVKKKEATVTAMTVDQVVESTRWASRNGHILDAPRKIRMEGVLAAGGIEKIQSSTGGCQSSTGGCEIHFRLAGERTQIDVNYSYCELPDTFRDVGGLRVRVEGYAEPSVVFDAETIRVVMP